jgi:retron-type reverse transcriptase
MSEPKPKDKPFAISKWVVWEAYQRVKATDGAAGVDGESIEAFERDLKGNLYKLWNRLSSGKLPSVAGTGSRNTEEARARPG